MCREYVDEYFMRETLLDWNKKESHKNYDLARSQNCFIKKSWDQWSAWTFLLNLKTFKNIFASNRA